MMSLRKLGRWVLAATVAATMSLASANAEDAKSSDANGSDEESYKVEEIFDAATGVFGATTEGLAKVIEKVFEDLGAPTAFIAGEEISGAFAVGLRYGKGELNRKGKAPLKVYWQGPSVGFDFGGNASKTFVLVYNLESEADIFQRFPGGEGMFYFVAGVGVNYQQAGDVVLAPIRTGVGLRTGANIGYLHYTEEFSLLPF